MAKIESIELVDAADFLDVRLHGQLLPSGDDIYNWLMKAGYYESAGQMGYLASWGVRLSRESIEAAFEDLWDEQQPMIVVSFVPFLNAPMRASLLRCCPACRLVTVITDMADCSEHTWLDAWDESAANHVIVVGTPELERQACDLGYGPSLLRTSGMLVHPDYYVKDEPLAPEASPKVVVFFGGVPPMRVEAITANVAAKHPDWRLVVLCGTNAELRRRLEGHKCLAEGFVPASRIRQHLIGAAFVLGKPGPGVAAEACVCGVPLVTERNGALPQELSVLRWLADSRVGVVVDDLEQLPLDVLAKAAECRAPLQVMPQNRAVFEVAGHVMRLACGGPLVPLEDGPWAD